MDDIQQLSAPPPGAAAPDASARLAAAVSQARGATGVAVGDRDGRARASAGLSQPQREAALAAFIASRAATLGGDSDLRGLGRHLAGSTFQHAILTGPGGEFMVVAHGEEQIFVTLDRSALAETVLGDVRSTLSRFA